jgi:ATP-dependent RNA helicase DeaD
MKEFKELGISEKLLQVINSLNFKRPSEIQEKAIPPILEGKDIIGQSATGSGKTLAFGAGIIEKTIPNKTLQSLVLVPTRELAEQVTNSLRNFSRNHNLKIQEIYGGVAISTQINNLPKADVVVGTPGRILDHLERRTINLKKIKILVLDEADRMVDMGFLEDVEKIIKSCSIERQTLLLSATITSDIDYISKKYLKNPLTISAESHVDPTKLKQIYYDTPSNIKFSLLVYLLKKEKSELVMVFCNTRRNVDIVAENLKRFNLKAIPIHGGLNQNKRTKTIEKFHSQNIKILVCTDVAARGLDIKSVSHIYNYDIPKNSTEYIHRIGRTARAGKEGEAISIVSNRDYDNFRTVLNDDSIIINQIKMPEIPILNPRFSQKGNDERNFNGNRGNKQFRRNNNSRDNNNRRNNNKPGKYRSVSGFNTSSRKNKNYRRHYKKSRN